MHILPAIFMASSAMSRAAEFGAPISARRGGRGVRAAAADGGNAVVGLDHVALAADQEGLLLVGDQQQCFQRAQHLVGAPVLGQLDCGAAQVAVVLLQLGLKAG